MKYYLLTLLFTIFYFNSVAQTITYTVTNGNASGSGSFADAIASANTQTSPNAVVQVNVVSIPQTLAFTISNTNLKQLEVVKTGSRVSFTGLEFTVQQMGSSAIVRFTGINTIKINYSTFAMSELKLDNCSNIVFPGTLSNVASIKLWNNDFSSGSFNLYASATTLIEMVDNITPTSFSMYLGRLTAYASSLSSIDFNNASLQLNQINLNKVNLTSCFFDITNNSAITSTINNCNFTNMICRFGGDYHNTNISNSNFTNSLTKCRSNHAYYTIQNCSFTSMLEIVTHYGATVNTCTFTGSSSGIYIQPLSSYAQGTAVKNCTFTNTNTAIQYASSPYFMHYYANNKMINNTNAFVFNQPFTSNVNVTALDTVANTIGGTCNCEKVMIYKNYNRNMNPQGQIIIDSVPCTSKTWNYTNTSGYSLLDFVYMERRINTSISTLGGKEAYGFSNGHKLELGPNITKCASRVLTLKSPIIAKSYQWSTGSTSSSIAITSAGTYKLTIIDYFNKTQVDSVIVSNDTGTGLLDIGSDSTICNGDSVRLASNILTGVNYIWSNGKTTSFIYAKTQGWYKLTIKDSCNNQSIDSLFITVNNLCGKISGKIYFDADSNCTFGGTDKTCKNIMVKAMPGNYYAFTDAMGNYMFLLPPNNYTISIVSGTTWRIKCPTVSTYNLNLSNNGNLTGNNFSLLTQKPSADLSIHHGSSVLLPLSAVTYTISYTNTGKIASGSVQFVLPDSVSYTGSVPAYGTVNGKVYTWNFTNLYPGETRQIKLTGNVLTRTIGQTISSCSRITPTITDFDSTDNNYCTADKVRGAIDPNDIQVSPVGLTSEGYIEPSDSVLTYTVRFQNVGTYMAFNVIITDTLSNNVNFETMSVLEASHNYYLQQTDNGVLKIKFKNINLPDSTTSKQNSMGFITYKVNLKPGLAAGTVIKNRAHIVFDIQAGILTNQVKNTIANSQPVILFTDTTACLGETIVLTASSTGGTYLWSTGDTTRQIVVTSTGTYYYLFTDGMGNDIQSNQQHIHFNTPVVRTQNIVVCTGGSITVGVNTYNSTGTYTDVFTASNGCDSTVTTILTVLNPISYTQNVVLCAGENIIVGTNTYTTAGNYTDVLTSVNGCDSTVYTNIDLYAINTTLTQSGTTLTSLHSAANYQWIDCATNIPVNGETGIDFTPSVTGSYAVVISANGCTDTSACYSVVVNGIGNGEFGKQAGIISLYPNPVTGKVTIEGIKNAEVELYNVLGELLITEKATDGNKLEINLEPLPKGMYTIKADKWTQKVIKE